MNDLKHYAAVALVLAAIAGVMYITPLSGDSLTSIGGGALAGGEVTSCDGSTIEISGAERELLELHNAVRAEHGAPTLCYQLSAVCEGLVTGACPKSGSNTRRAPLRSTSCARRTGYEAYPTRRHAPRDSRR